LLEKPTSADSAVHDLLSTFAADMGSSNSPAVSMQAFSNRAQTAHLRLTRFKGLGRAACVAFGNHSCKEFWYTVNNVDYPTRSSSSRCNWWEGRRPWSKWRRWGRRRRRRKFCMVQPSLVEQLSSRFKVLHHCLHVRHQRVLDHVLARRVFCESH
jgi:hypothetical protein